MRRLAALVPQPGLHLIRFRGVLALSFTNSARLRAMVVPAGPAEATGASESGSTEQSCTHGRPARIAWVRLLKRVFELDLEHSPNCAGGPRIAVILEAPVIERILTHLGLQARAPPRAQARGHVQNAA